MTGNALSDRNRRRSSFHCNQLYEVKPYDIYAAYSENDVNGVFSVLEYIRDARYNVYDPHMDGRANETVIKAWLERGIYRSKMTLIFLTKAFVGCELCRFQSECALMRYAMTKGRHKLLLVMIESCRIPKNFQHLSCVYAWKHREEPLKQNERILRAICAPKPRFHRGLWPRPIVIPTLRKPNCNTGAIVKKQDDLMILKLVFNLPGIQLALRNCQLQCTSENCAFVCNGTEIFTKFIPHLKDCKYQQICCRNCCQRVQKKNLLRHQDKYCKMKPVRCQHESCECILPAKMLKAHLVTCPYRKVRCPYAVHGCSNVFAAKDKTGHLKLCAYVTIQCIRCRNIYFRLDIDTHECATNENIHRNHIKRENEVYRCSNPNCQFRGSRLEVASHVETCPFKVHPCSECGKRFSIKDLATHGKDCHALVECTVCKIMVPSISKVTHDRWSCRGRTIRSRCTNCGIMVNSNTLDTHQSSCTLSNTTEHDSPIQTALSKKDEQANVSQEKQKEDIRPTIHVIEKHLDDPKALPIVGSPETLMHDCKLALRDNLWSKNKRKRWRDFMESIEQQNQLDHITFIF